MSEGVIIDRLGRRRRARKGDVLADGERYELPALTLMDAKVRDAFAEVYGDNAFGTGGDPPVVVSESAAAVLAYARYVTDRAASIEARHADAAQTLADSRKKAAEAFAKRSAELRDAWRDPPPSADDKTKERAAPSFADASAARAAAEAAWKRRGEQVRNAWKGA
jgi:hypothetical protein